MSETAVAAAPPETITITIGGTYDEESGKRYASRSGSPFTVTLSKYDAEKGTAKKLADLLETPPEDPMGTSDVSEEESGE